MGDRPGRSPTGWSLMVEEFPKRIGRYRILGVLGRGGMGVLYHARDERSHRDVALKVMQPDVMADEHARARFQAEARLAAETQHRNVVRVFECGEDDGVPFIAMELLQGTTLARHLASGAVLPLEDKLDVLVHVCEGLQHLHERGIVHGDVKPSNIWLVRNGGVKLLDLGIATEAGSDAARPGVPVGSAAYMSPEQASGQPVDGRADIFSAGVVLYELLSGHRPFEAETVTLVLARLLQEDPRDIRLLVPEIPEEVAQAVETALQKDPKRRYASAAEFAADLRLARDEDRTPRAVRAAEAVTRITPPDAAAAPNRRGNSTGSHTGGGAGEVSESTDWVRAVPEQVPGRLTPGRTGEGSDWARPRLTTARMGGRLALVAVAALAIVAAVWWSSPAPYVIDVQSVPPGAAILVDGQETGAMTPASLTLDTLPTRIALGLDGYAPADLELTDWHDQRTTVRQTLRRLLEIRSEPAGARVVLDGDDTGLVTPARVTLNDPPQSGLALQLEGYVPASRELTTAILEGGEVNVRLDPVPPPPAEVARPRTTQVSVTVVSKEYAFDVAGCGTRSAAAERHDIRVAAPCELRLRAPEHFLDVTYEVTDKARQVSLSPPPLVSVHLRSRHQNCQVVIGGRSVGFPGDFVQVAQGTSVRVTLQCPDGRTPTTTQPLRADGLKSIWSIDDYLPPSF